jgi:hypothetical protein
MIGRRSFLALPLASIAPTPASAGAKVGFVISDMFDVLGISMDLENAKSSAVKLEMQRYKKYYDLALPAWGSNGWWKENHPKSVSYEFRPAKDKSDRWELWGGRGTTDYRCSIKIDAVQVKLA